MLPIVVRVTINLFLRMGEPFCGRILVEGYLGVRLMRQFVRLDLRLEGSILGMRLGLGIEVLLLPIRQQGS